MERARGRASKNDAFSQYEPWDNPNYYAGVLRFESGGRNFRIERSFDKITKSASLICEDDGEELSIEQGDLDVLLDGMTESSFENTIAIAQLRVETNQDLAAELKNYAANYYESGDGDIDVQRALNTLKARSHEVDLQIKQETLKKERMRSKIEQECDYVRRDLEKLKKEEYTYREAREAEDTDALQMEEEQIPEKKKLGKRSVCMAVLIFVVLAAVETGLFFLSKGKPWNIAILAVSIVVDLFFLLQVLASILRFGLKNQKVEQEAKQSAPVQHRHWEVGRIRANIHEKQVRLNNLGERLEELEVSGFEITQEDKKRQAIQLASETIAQLSSEIIKGFGTTLNENASEIISAITNGKYEKIYIDEKLNMFLLTKEKRVAIDRLSRGTIEQIYFALRMAAIDVLYEEDFPVILDDTFVFYDDERLESILKWLSTQKRQVILFTCQRREMEILKRLNLPYSMN